MILVLGDQLSMDTASLRAGDAGRDVVVMAEVEAEIRRYANHKQRVAVFLAAMRHFREELRSRGWTVKYYAADDADPVSDLPSALGRAIAETSADRVIVTEPGRHGLIAALRAAAGEAGAVLDVREDDHFLCSHDEFEAWAAGRKRLTMEYFYRDMRRRLDVLMEDGEPAGGAWNFDRDNRASFSAEPGDIKAPIRFRPDALTNEVLSLVEMRYADLPGSLDAFDWPVTHDEARRAVLDFVEHRLPRFGTYQDAMWTDRPFLYHAKLAAALNLKLIDPRYVVRKAVEAWQAGAAPINSVEGFVRQIIGWREFIRGVYWLHMPDLEGMNALDQRRELPELYWTAETEMACMRQVVRQLLDTGYAHHIQRLMVTGLFALLYGVRPQHVHDWYMALFVDSVEWVTLPNVIGMSQYADGGIVGTKPYVASGAYIKRQSNYCSACRFDPSRATGDDACPFTVLYWDFLMRHEEGLADNRRMAMQLRNLERKADGEKEEIRREAERVRRAVREGRL